MLDLWQSLAQSPPPRPRRYGGASPVARVTERDSGTVCALTPRSPASLQCDSTHLCGLRSCLVLRPALAAAFLPFLEPGLSTLLSNPTFCASAWAWVLAQTLKVSAFGMFLLSSFARPGDTHGGTLPSQEITEYVKTRAWDVRVLVRLPARSDHNKFSPLSTRASSQFDSGGMPSSHTALVVGLSTSVAVQHGLGSSLFVVCLAFSLIVMYDAAGVRRHAGKQAEVLNALVEDYFQGHPVSEQELKEVLGHTPLQVGMGALLGIAVGLIYHAKCG